MPAHAALKINIGRKRRTLGWTLLTLGVVAAAVWVLSSWVLLSYKGVGWSIEARPGCIRSVRDLRPGLTGGGWQGAGSGEGLELRWYHPDERADSSIFWWERFGSRELTPYPTPTVIRQSYGPVYLIRSSSYTVCVAGLWPIPLLLGVAAALLLRASGVFSRRRAAHGLCASCGYSLAGLSDYAPCPECGKRTR